MRALSAAVAAVAVLGAVAAIAAAQTAVPTVTVTASTTALAAQPTPVAPGATRFEFVSEADAGGEDVSVFLAAVKRGWTADEVIAALRQSPDGVFERADIVASAGLPAGGRRAITVEIAASTTYLLISDAGVDDPAKWIVTPLATGGAPTGATAPEPDADLLMRDNRFAGDRTLPRDGTIRIRNIGWAPHIAIAAPLKRGATKAAVAKAVLSGRERAMGRVLNFRGTVTVAEVLTRGAATDQEVTFTKRGRHVMICFVEGHNAQGMYRFFSVR